MKVRVRSRVTLRFRDGLRVEFRTGLESGLGFDKSRFKATKNLRVQEFFRVKNF